jgi:hypothetical protein
MSENDWGSKAARSLREQIENRKRRDIFLRQAEVIRQEQGPRLWNDIREHIKAKCIRLNAELGSDVALVIATQTRELEVHLYPPLGGRRTLSARFSTRSPLDALSWNTSGHETNEAQEGKYRIGIEEGVAVLQGSDDVVETPERIAERLLDALLLE